MFRTLCAVALSAAVLTAPAAAQDKVRLKVAGNLLATGLILKNKEQPFFETMAETTGLPITVDYKPMDVTGIKDTEGLRVLKSGLFDIVSLRLTWVSRDEPFFDGLDLIGLNPDYKSAREVSEIYKDALDQRLQERFNAKVLGLWAFGPQVLFCKPEISGLADLKGKKVRVYSQSLAQFIESIGGTPVALNFGEVQQALARGVVDCAITGPSSANSAGWPEVTRYFMPIGFGVGFNAYGMNLDTWKKFTPEQQTKLEAAFDSLIEDIWDYSEELYVDAVRCNVGKDPCTTVKKYDMHEVPVTEADLKLLRAAVPSVSFPAWSKICEQSYPGCGEKWKTLLGDYAGVK